MRVALALTAALAAALPAVALAADGPVGAMQRGLNWAFKRDPEQPPPPVAPQTAERPAPMALSDQFSRGRVEAPEPARLPPPPGRYRAAVAPPYQIFTPQVPLPLQAQAQRAAAQPASLYSPAPMAQVQAPVARVPVAQAPAAPQPIRTAVQAAPAPRPASPPPQLLATAPEPTPPQRIAAAPPTPRTVGGATRLYSVHRSYGMEPDAIPAGNAENRYVLIGPAASGVGGVDDANDDEAPDSRPGAL